jgi:hypothetical protein
METLVGLARPFASLQALPFQVAYSLYCPYLCFFRTTASVAANTGSTDLIYCFTCYPTTAFIDSLYFRRDIATGLEWGSSLFHGYQYPAPILHRHRICVW